MLASISDSSAPQRPQSPAPVVTPEKAKFTRFSVQHEASKFVNLLKLQPNQSVESPNMKRLFDRWDKQSLSTEDYIDFLRLVTAKTSPYDRDTKTFGTLKAGMSEEVRSGYEFLETCAELVSLVKQLPDSYRPESELGELLASRKELLKDISYSEDLLSAVLESCTLADMQTSAFKAFLDCLPAEAIRPLTAPFVMEQVYGAEKQKLNALSYYLTCFAEGNIEGEAEGSLLYLLEDNPYECSKSSEVAQLARSCVARMDEARLSDFLDYIVQESQGIDLSCPAMQTFLGIMPRKVLESSPLEAFLDELPLEHIELKSQSGSISPQSSSQDSISSSSFSE